MLRSWQAIVVGLVALCWCASGVALSQEAGGGTQAERVSQAEEVARLRELLAERSREVSWLAGRLDGIEEATNRAAAAGENAAKSSQDVITTIGSCTKFVTGMIAIVGGLLGFVGYRELKGIQAVREQAEQALKETARKAEDAVKKASECAATSAKSLEEMQQSERRARELLESAEEMRGEIADRREKVTMDAAVVAHLRKQVEAGAKLGPTKEVSAKERETLEDASRAADRLDDLGEELTPEAYVARGNYYFGLNEYERALDSYNEAIKLKPDYAQAHFNTGVALVARDRHEEALGAFDRAIQFEPDDAEAHYNRGVTLGKLREYEEAAGAYDQAIKLEPDYASAYYNRACAYSRLDRRVEALRDLKKAIELDEKSREMARTDEDFEGLRDDPEFRKLVGLDEDGGEQAE